MIGARHCKVLIVAKTHLGLSSACIGALTLDGKQQLRLMKSGGGPYPADVGYAVGQTWDLRYRPRPEVQRPHVEDVLVQEAYKLQQECDLRSYLLDHVQPWRGAAQTLFEATLKRTSTGRYYCSARGGWPSHSTGFWIPDQPLTQVVHELKVAYRYGAADAPDSCEIAYVGFAPALATLPAGSLLRVSLARAWQQPGTSEERCYLQLSGWYD